MTEVTIPSVGESVTEVQIARWHKQEGEWVDADETLVDLETEKASVQVPAPTSGYIRNIQLNEGDFAQVGAVLCEIEEAEKPAGGGASSPQGEQPASSQKAPPTEKPGAAQDAKSPASEKSQPGAGTSQPSRTRTAATGQPRIMPAAERLMEEHGITIADVTGSGPGGRILKEDVQAVIDARQKQQRAAAESGDADAASGFATPESSLSRQSAQETSRTRQGFLQTGSGEPAGGRLSSESRMEEVRPMSMIRRTIAARLVEAQHNAALLTTFNEINMQPIIDLRQRYRDAFQQRYGVKLGFMSFFVKASVEALRRFPAVNAEIRGNNIVYKYYHDIGIAVSSDKGLVVPVLRNCEYMTFADIERAIDEYARKARENRLSPEDLEGGTFTISNGGVFGSLLSTPIVNPPQSAILGLHAIQDRPIAVDGKVEIRPMMYVALTYDHRIIDGREAVTFLRTIKEVCEDPARLLIEV